MSSNTATTNAKTNDATGTQRRYLAAEVGLNEKGQPFGFHIEGYISKPAYFSEADLEEDKAAFLTTSIGIAMTPERLMALAEGTYDSNADYGEPNGFLDLRMTGKTAEDFSQSCVVGAKVAVTGRLEWKTFTKKDSTEGRSLVVVVYKIVLMGGKTIEPKLTDSIGVATRVYTGKDSVTRFMPMATLVTGTVLNNWGVKTGGDNNKPYLPISVKVGLPAEEVYDRVSGKYDKDKEYGKSRILNVTLFDKAAMVLANILRKGAQVALTGSVYTREYNGETRYQMLPRVVSVMKYAPKDESSADNTADGSPSSSAATEAPGYPVDASGFAPIDDDDDGELPF